MTLKSHSPLTAEDFTPEANGVNGGYCLIAPHLVICRLGRLVALYTLYTPLGPDDLPFKPGWPGHRPLDYNLPLRISRKQRKIPVWDYINLVADYGRGLKLTKQPSVKTHQRRYRRVKPLLVN